MSFVGLFRVSKRFIVYHPKYKGPFDYKRDHTKSYLYPPGINKLAIEDEFNEIKQLRQYDDLKQQDISPFHLVWRHKKMGFIKWHEKFVLSHLGLHQRELGIRVVVPNTPHFNQLLWKVKHVIQLLPMHFPDGIPTQDDVGACKLNHHTGVMTINAGHKVSNERLEAAKTDDIFRGKYLREYLKWCSGLIGKGLPHSGDVIDLDGHHIEDYKRKMANANKHQHHFYNN